MTKKEFIKRMDKIKNERLTFIYDFSCSKVRKYLGYNANSYYQSVVSPYILGPWFLDDEYRDSLNTFKTIRILMLTTFEIECLESGIYKEF